MAFIPNSLEFLQLSDIGLTEEYTNDAASEELTGAQKIAVGIADEDPTGLTSNLL